MATSLDIGTEWFNNSEFYVTLMPPIKFLLNLTYCLRGDLVWWISRCSHLGHWNRMILAILNFHNIPMSPIMFKLNQTYLSGADVIWSISRWLPWWPAWISEQSYFSNSKSPCCPNAFHQVSAPSDLLFRADKTENFPGGCNGSHHGYDSDGDV